jgi:hypothetical protein
MKGYIHARIRAEDRTALEELKEKTGQSESEIVRHGLQLMVQEQRRRQTALELAGKNVGRFTIGPRDLSSNRKHLDGFGQ